MHESVSANYNENNIHKFLEILYKEKGWDFRNYRKSSLSRRILRRLSAYNISSYEDYYRILTSDPAEYERLFLSLTVKVSEFFRDPEVFDILKDAIALMAPDIRDGLRAWCCGCAYGEEAYSLAILFSECLKPEVLKNTKIFATDIDNKAIEAARKGIYIEDVLHNLSCAIRDKYFIKKELGYKVKYSLKDLVRFGQLDIVRNPPLSRIDILFSRNLFMYFEKELQKNVFEKLNFALKPGGLLVLGKSEVLPVQFMSNYREIKKSSRVYRKELRK